MESAVTIDLVRLHRRLGMEVGLYGVVFGEKMQTSIVVLQKRLFFNFPSGRAVVN